MGGFRGLSGFASDPLVLVPLGGADRARRPRRRDRRRHRGEARLDPPRARDEARRGDDGRPDRRRDARPARCSSGRTRRRSAALPPLQRPLNALFESIAFRSAGMTHDPDRRAHRRRACSSAIALMFIGTASGSTGGGIKLTTFSILLATIVSTVLGRPHTEAFGRRVPEVVVYRALSVALLSVAIVFGDRRCCSRSRPAAATSCRSRSRRCRRSARSGHSTGITPTLPRHLAAACSSSRCSSGGSGRSPSSSPSSARARPVTVPARARDDPHRLTTQGARMKTSVLVIGLGRFGASAARELMALGHEVLAVDRTSRSSTRSRPR